MIANYIVLILNGILSIVIIPIQIVTTFVLGILSGMPILGAPILLIIFFLWWIIFYFPLICLSYIYEKIYFLRIPISIIGIPLSVLANIYCALTPSMGDMEMRAGKLLFSEFFPFNWHLHHFSKRNLDRIYLSKGYLKMHKIFKRFSQGKQFDVTRKYNDITRKYINHLKAINNI